MKVLIGSNGGLTGIYLAKELRKIEDIYLLGSDASIVTTGKYFVDEQLNLPSATNDGFVDALIGALNDYNVDIYLPTHSKEVKVVSKNYDYIRHKTKAKFIVSPYSSYEALDNKRDANKALSNLGVSVPKLYSDNEFRVPVFMKKDIGSGSSGCMVIDSELILEDFRKIYTDASYYEYISGAEFTVDCLFDFDGNLLICNQRIREKTIGGAVSITKSDNSFDIKPWIKKISNKYKLCGCVNFQYILKDNVPYFIDVNLRYASGGLPLTVEAGANIPLLLIRMLSGEDVTNLCKNIKLKDVRMYRYFEEIIEEL